MPITVFGKTFDHFEQAVSYVMEHGKYDNETAKRIVGKAQSEQESIKETVSKIRELSNTGIKESITMEKGCLVKLAGLPRDKVLQEATKILDDNKATKLVRYTVGLALRMTDDEEKKKTLEEAEAAMQEGYETPEDKEKKKLEEIAQSGESTQSTSTTDVSAGVSDKLRNVGHPEGARDAPGKNHGEGKVMETTFDMNAAIVKNMAGGKTHQEAMSLARAEREQFNDNKMQEAIKAVNKNSEDIREVAKAVQEAIKSINSQIKTIQETTKGDKPGTLTFTKTQNQIERSVSVGKNLQETTVDLESIKDDIRAFDTFLDASES